MLDQGQVLKIGTQDVTYQLVTFDGMRTERMAKVPAGTSVFRIDHQSNSSKGTARHLMQLSHPVKGSTPETEKERGSVTVNLTITTNGVCNDADTITVVNAVIEKVPTILVRVLMNES